MFARISSPSATDPTGFARLRTVLSKLWTPALVLLAVLTSSSLSPGLAGSTPPRESPTPQQPKAQAEPIAWSDLGSKATAQYSGPGLSIDTQPDGTIALHCLFQKLEGQLTSRGLSLFSTTSPSHPDRFSITADSVGREGASAAALPETGSTHSDTTRARFVRPGLIEEYSVSADGVRQDFLLPTRPEGAGPLRLSLLVRGAQLQPKGSGVDLIVNNSQRKIAYTKLAVTDANQQPLNARFEILSSDRLAVVVDDSSAAYPLRIDPTFSDSNWVDSWGGDFGATVTSYANNANNDGVVRAVVADGSGNLYIGGGFTKAGSTTVNRIAKWNGTSWSALGSGMNAAVHALAISGSDLYAGGNFTTAGGTTVNRIAKWNGSAWSTVGSGTGMGDGGLGFGAEVRTLVFKDSDLYVGGDFVTVDGTTVNRIAKWNGSTWSALGSGIGGSKPGGGAGSAEVYALAFIGDDLFVGGGFSTAGGTGMNNIAKWSTTANSWSSIGGADATVDALAVSGSDLYVGGDFQYVDTNGSVSANRMAKWSTTANSWSPLSNFGVQGRVTSILISGTDVYVGGMFQTVRTGLNEYPTVNYLAVWSTTANSWSALGSGMSTSESGEWNTPYVYALAISSGQLHAVGNFLKADNSEVRRLARWDGSQWQGLFDSSNGVSLGNQYVNAIALVGSDVYVAGYFSRIGNILANNIAKWNGSSWSALGSGTDYEVFALASSGSDLYVGGDFSTVNGSSANYIAKYNGSAWSTLGSGTDSTVYAMGVSGADVFAGGSFTTAGGTTVNRIAKWNGSSWSALGSGVDGTVRALAVSGTSLYVGGSFTAAGDLSASRIAKWHLSLNRWSALGLGVDNTVYSLAANSSDLYMGGAFLNAGGRSANYVARWNGSSWSALGSGLNGTVYGLALSGVTLYAGGAFTTAGGSAANYIAKWNGSSWSAMGSGTGGNGSNTYGDINCLTTTGTSLYVGGYFSTAGSHSAGRIAKLTWSEVFEVASDPSFTRAKGAPLRIPISNLASDLNGNAISVTAVGSSSQGATVTYNSSFILYSPANNLFDSFSYTVSNGSSSLSGTAYVETEYFPGAAKTLTVSGGSVTVTFLGIPGHHYDIQRTTSLSGEIVWTTLTNTPPGDNWVTAGADGSFSYTDSTAPDGTAFYRCIQVLEGGDRYGG